MGQLVLLPKVSDLRKVESFVKTRHTLLVDWQTKSEQLVRQDRLAEHGQPILETLKGDGHAIITMEAFQDKASEHDAEALPPLSAPTNYPRLSTPAVIRIPGAVVIGFGIGAFLGAAHGGKMAALRFRAENAHRLPTSTKGWYLYHKSKNYHAMLQGLREAGKMGSKIGFWVGGFFYLENMIDMSRGGRKDFLSTTLSGLTVAGTFSAWSKTPLKPLSLARIT